MKQQGKWYYGEVRTPLGPMVVSLFNEKVIRIDFGTFSEKKDFYENWACKYVEVHAWQESDERIAPVKNEINEYYEGKRTTFTFPYVLYGTEFQTDVWKCLVDDIPFGVLKTYKDVAVGVNRPKAFRAVGGAVNKNPISIAVPCHRVVGSNGSLVGYGGGLDKKEYLLHLEHAN